jgi:hypothetical protein
VRGPKSVTVGLDLKVLHITGTWEPNDAERRAAWELYVELLTRAAVVPLPADQGLMRESLASLYSLFGTTRDILRRYGPDLAETKPHGQYNFAYLAVAILNLVVRPTLTRWHPELEGWEAARPVDRSRREHEVSWARAAELRQDLATTRSYLSRWAALLATVNDIPDLSAAIPVHGPEPAQ